LVPNQQDVETGTCPQTDVGMDLIGSMESEIQRLLEENNKLKNICNETVFSHEYFTDNNEKLTWLS
jgi:alanine racemase